MDLVRDARRFILSHKGVIEMAPLQVYASALVFSPTRSVVKKYFQAEEPDWITTKPAMEADWNACLQTLEGHSGPVNSVVFSSDGQRLASASHDGTIKIWHAASGQCIQTDYVGLVFTLSFDPTDSHLLTDNGLIEVSPSSYTMAPAAASGHAGPVAAMTREPRQPQRRFRYGVAYYR